MLERCLPNQTALREGGGPGPVSRACNWPAMQRAPGPGENKERSFLLTPALPAFPSQGVMSILQIRRLRHREATTHATMSSKWVLCQGLKLGPSSPQTPVCHSPVLAPLVQESGEQELGFKEGAMVTSCCVCSSRSHWGLQVQVGFPL